MNNKDSKVLIQIDGPHERDNETGKWQIKIDPPVGLGTLHVENIFEMTRLWIVLGDVVKDFILDKKVTRSDLENV